MDLKYWEAELAKQQVIFAQLERVLYGQSGKINFIKEKIEEIKNPKKDDGKKK